jgi:polyphosphate kinase
MIDYEDLTPDPIELPAKIDNKGYVRPPINETTYVPEVY